MRRKANALVPLEEAICAAAAALRVAGVEEFHGYELAKQLADHADQKLLTAYGTLYRALGRLESADGVAYDESIEDPVAHVVGSFILVSEAPQ